MDIEQAVNGYRAQIHTYERFTLKVRDLLDELLTTDGVNATYEHRTKDVDHFREKITRLGKSYNDPLREVTDLCGVRIIVRRVTDVLKVVEIVKNEFDIDDENSVYKADELDVNQFGYTSVHLVATLNKSRHTLTEWKPFSQIKAEIQVRTILQHAWAVISHAFDYKVGADIPREFRRRLFRLSALFELADEELDNLVDGIEEKIEEYRESLSTGDRQIELNVDSLRTYLETAIEFQYWVDYVQNKFRMSLEPPGDVSRSVAIFKYFGVDSMEGLQQLVNGARAWGESFFEEFYPKIADREGISLEKIKTTKNGLLSLLVVAANAERIDPEKAAEDLDLGGIDVVRETALQVRGIDLKHKS